MTVCTGKHERPVHFNRGRHGHVWMCIACGKQLAGPKLPEDEREVLVEYANYLVCNGRSLKPADKAETEEQMETQQFSITILVPMHASNEDIAVALRHRAGLFAGMSAKEAGSRENTDTEPPVKKAKKTAPVVEAEEAEESDDDEDFAPKKTAAKKAAASFDDEDEETEEEEAPKAKAKKAPKITLDDVNDACKARAAEEGGGKAGREVVVGILKKKFKTTSVGELKPEQYAAVIEVMTGEA